MVSYMPMPEWFVNVSLALCFAFPLLVVFMTQPVSRKRFLVAVGVVLLICGASVFADQGLVCAICLRCNDPDISWAEWLLLGCWQFGL